jgi:hypothetical protein
MKTPKEKADELYETFYEFSEMEGTADWGNVFKKASKESAKRSALKVCDEVIQSWWLTCNGNPDAPIFQYWNEVKKYLNEY